VEAFFALEVKCRLRRCFRHASRRRNRLNYPQLFLQLFILSFGGGKLLFQIVNLCLQRFD